MRIEDMVDRVVSRFIGTKHERDIKRLAPKVAAIKSTLEICQVSAIARDPARNAVAIIVSAARLGPVGSRGEVAPHQTPITYRSCQASGLKYNVPTG